MVVLRSHASAPPYSACSAMDGGAKGRKIGLETLEVTSELLSWRVTSVAAGPLDMDPVSPPPVVSPQGHPRPAPVDPPRIELSMFAPVERQPMKSVPSDAQFSSGVAPPSYDAALSYLTVPVVANQS